MVYLLILRQSNILSQLLKTIFLSINICLSKEFNYLLKGDNPTNGIYHIIPILNILPDRLDQTV